MTNSTTKILIDTDFRKKQKGQKGK